MKLEKTISCIWSSVLAFLVSAGGICCLATGFSMAVDVSTLVICCAAAAVLCSVCYTLPLGPVPLCAGGVLGVLLWQSGRLEETFQSLIYRLSRQYDMAYGWGILRPEMRTADDLEQTLTLGVCVLGVLIAMVVAWGVSRKKPILPGVLMGLFPLALCLVVTDTVPEESWLVILMFGVVMLLLTQTVRRQDESQGNRLSALLALPVAVLLLILFAATPQESYTGQATAKNMVDGLLHTELVENLFGRFVENEITGSGVDGGTVQLSSVGVRLSSQAEVMRVTADYNSNLYLRGRALDAYDGLTWTDSGTSTEKLKWWPVDMAEAAGEVSISTRYAHRMLYLPYYVESIDMNEVTRGKENKKKLTQYSFYCMEVPGAEIFRERYPSPMTPATETPDLSAYIHLTDRVKAWAEPLAKEIIGDIQNPYHQALAIGNYVRNSAKYDTNTRRMPRDEEDFASWFLEESETGYCVHFATAATVLLQAAGIPARYVTGYTAQVKRGLFTVVRSDDAHAWTEYWLPGFGWTILEATPSGEESQETTGTTVSSENPEDSQTLPQPTESTQQTPQPTRPQSQSRPEQKEPLQLQKLLPVLWGIAVVLGAAVIAALQWYLRRKLWKKRLERGTTNEQAILLWKEAVRYARVLGQNPDSGLFEIAQKAKFSQHTLQPEELVPFEAWLQAGEKTLRRRSVFRQFHYRVILALY